MLVRIIISSDLNSHITGKEHIRRMVAGIAHAQPDLVVLAGNLGNPSRLFEDCLSLFAILGQPVAVVCGRRDLWCEGNENSESLYKKTLPRIVGDMGYYWLNGNDPLIVGNVGIAGSVGWFDTEVTRAGSDGLPAQQLEQQRLNWKVSDSEFAQACSDSLCNQLRALEENPEVDRVLVATHFPMFENQLDQKLDEVPTGEPLVWHRALGARVASHPKVRWAVCGCIPTELHGVAERNGMTPIATAVVGSRFYRPRYLILDTD